MANMFGFELTYVNGELVEQMCIKEPGEVEVKEEADGE